MIRTNFREGGHDWEKVNLITLENKNGSMYDLYRCRCCGLEAKMYSINELMVNERSRRKLAACPGLKKTRQIEITNCQAVGNQFANLTPGSIHDIIEPPTGYNRNRGEWVMGVGEPVLVLFSEFIYAE